MKTGEDDGTPSWYPLPFNKVNVIGNGETKVNIGTYKHTKCSGKTTASSRCLNCQNSPHLKSFQLRLNAAFSGN